MSKLIYFSEESAQGALEYLLLIGGAVLIAAIVLTLLTGIGQQGTGVAYIRVNATQCESLGESRCTDQSWSDFDGDTVPDCIFDIDLQKCTVVSEAE